MPEHITRRQFEKDIKQLLVQRIGIKPDDVPTVLEYIDSDIKRYKSDYRIPAILSSLIIYIADAHISTNGKMEMDIVLQNHRTSLESIESVPACSACHDTGVIYNWLQDQKISIECPWCGGETE